MSYIESIVSHFLARRRREREQIARYLEDIAEYAGRLAAIWVQLLEEYSNGAQEPSVPVPEPLLQRIDEMSTSTSFRRPFTLSRHRHVQIPVFTALSYFYEELFDVIGGKLDLKTERTFIDTLARLLADRQLAREVVEWRLSQLPNVRVTVLGDQSRQEVVPAMLFVDGSIDQADVTSLSTAVLALQKEAAALDVLAKTFRAKM